MLSIPRREFCDSSLVLGAPPSLYILKQRENQTLIVEFSVQTGAKRTIAGITPRKVYAALAFDGGKVAVLGGGNLKETVAYADCLEIDVVTGVGCRLPEVNYPRTKASAVYHKSGLFVFGGFALHTKDGTEKYLLSPTIEKLTPGNWVVLGITLPVPLARPALVSFENRVFILGGVASAKQSSKSVFEVSFSSFTVQKLCEAPFSFEEGYPVSLVLTRSALTFHYRRRADDRLSTVAIPISDWELRKTLLFARLRLQRLTTI